MLESTSVTRSAGSPLDVLSGTRSVLVIVVHVAGPTGDDLDAFTIVRGDDDYDRLTGTWERAKLMARGVRSDIERVEEKLRKLASSES